MKPTPKDIEKREPSHLPVEPEMDRKPGLDHDKHGRTPETEPEKEKRVDDL